MFNNYFNDYVRFASISKGKFPLEFTMPDIKFHGNENPYHHVIHFVSVMTLKGIYKDIFTLYFLRLLIWTL